MLQRRPISVGEHERLNRVTGQATRETASIRTNGGLTFGRIVTV